MPLLPPLFFPLDEELGLLPGALTPSVVENLVRLGTWLPFAPAAGMLAHFTRVRVGASTARRLTEQAGAAYEAVQTAAVARLEREVPPAPQGPAVQLLSADGAMVPLVGGEWAEVKTLALGDVQKPRVNRRGEQQIHTTNLSYFSRLADHETFGRLATVETHRRGTETAGVVCAVVDGAEWEQGFIALHRPDAVRILDWAHAVEYLDAAAQAAYGTGTVRAQTWLAQQRHALTHGDPQRVLAALRALGEEVGGLVVADGSDATGPGAVITRSLEYLEKRQAQLQYAAFAAAGYPRGSGSVESANKLVVEARLKGAGMRWARAHVNPVVALRTVACSDRWAEAWPQITAQWRAHVWRRRQDRATARRQGQAATADTAAAPPAEPVPAPPPAPSRSAPAPVAPPTGRRGPRRPAADHPWRHSPIGRARCA